MNQADREAKMALTIGVLAGTLMSIQRPNDQQGQERITHCWSIVNPLIEELFYKKEKEEVQQVKRRIQT